MDSTQPPHQEMVHMHIRTSKHVSGKLNFNKGKKAFIIFLKGCKKMFI